MGGKKMIQIILCAVCATIFFVIAYSIQHKSDFNESNSYVTVGTIKGIDMVQGGAVRYNIKFTDLNGIERTGYSQQFAHTKGKRCVGDSVDIKYTITQRFGLDAIKIRIQDENLKEDGAKVATVLVVIGAIFTVFFIVSVFKFFC